MPVEGPPQPDHEAKFVTIRESARRRLLVVIYHRRPHGLSHAGNAKIERTDSARHRLLRADGVPDQTSERTRPSFCNPGTAVSFGEPGSHFLRALGWLRDAGLEECTARTFAGEAHAPPTADLRSALTALFQMRWPGVESELTWEDRAQYQRLCLPE